MSDHVIYLDRFQIREGKLDDFNRYAKEYSEFVEKNEPGVISFNFYVDEDGTEGTAVFAFFDAEALDLHLGLAGSRFQEGYQLLSATDIELLGRPSDRAIEMAASFNASLKTRLLAGFSRYEAQQETR
jgi:quinol monooxygenase YgiN